MDIALFDKQTGKLNGHIIPFEWDDLGIMLDGKRMVLAHPNRTYWYLMTIITAGAEFQVHISDFARCQVARKPYAAAYIPAVYRYQVYRKTPFEPEPVVSAKTPQTLAQACKERGIRYQEIELSLSAPDLTAFRSVYAGDEYAPGASGQPRS